MLVAPDAWDWLRSRLAAIGGSPPGAAAPAAPGGNAFRLRIARPSGAPRLLALAPRRYRVGRAADNEIVLDDPSHTVSRRHAELQPGPGGYVVVDCQSVNGIWVEGVRVGRVTLEPEVPVVIGPFQLVLEDLGSTVGAIAPPAPRRAEP